jgi:hypothetical protein
LDPKGRAIYKAPSFASNNFTRFQMPINGSSLAARAKECAPGGLNNAANGGPARRAWLAVPIIDDQSFLVKIGILSGSAVVEDPVAAAGPGEIKRQGAADGDRVIEDFANGAPETRHLITF